MKAIVLTAPHIFAMLDLPTPVPAPGQALIKTAAFGICATDLVMAAGDPRVKPPAILGHEWSGVVAEVGAGVDPQIVGQPCAGDNVLSDGGEVGFEHPGAYGEYFLTDAGNLQFLPAQFPFHLAVLMEPLAVSVRGLRRLQLVNRQNALLFGDGPIGLLMLILLQRLGVRDLCLVGGRDHRLELARQFGAMTTINYHTCPGSLADAIQQAHPGRFANLIEASGNPAALQASLEVAAPDAHLLVIGDYGDQRANFFWNDLLHLELQITGSNASQGAWPEALRLFSEANLPLESLVTHRFPVSAFAQAFGLVKSRTEKVIKVVVEW